MRGNSSVFSVGFLFGRRAFCKYESKFAWGLLGAVPSENEKGVKPDLYQTSFAKCFNPVCFCPGLSFIIVRFHGGLQLEF